MVSSCANVRATLEVDDDSASVESFIALRHGDASDLLNLEDGSSQGEGRQRAPWRCDDSMKDVIVGRRSASNSADLVIFWQSKDMNDPCCVVGLATDRQRQWKLQLSHWERDHEC